MSKAEVERFAKLLREWAKNPDSMEAQDRLHVFLADYEQSLISALRLYAHDKEVEG
jgi:hypothetical protein